MSYLRGEGKTNTDFGTTLAYQNLIKNNPELKGKVTPELHSKILHQFHILLLNKMIQEAYIFSMPGMGTIAVKRRKIKIRFEPDGRLRTYNLPVDYNETLKLWKRDPVAAKSKRLVFFSNDHTNGWRYTWHWHRNTRKNFSLYKFIPCRNMKRQLAKALKNVHKDLSFFGK